MTSDLDVDIGGSLAKGRGVQPAHFDATEDFDRPILVRQPERPLKVAIVLPPHFAFSVENPNSIETVVRTLAEKSRYRATIRVFSDASDVDTGDIATIPVDPAGSRRARTRRVIAALRSWNPGIIELHQHAPTSAMIARALWDRPSYFYRHNFLKPPRTLFQRIRYTMRYRGFDAHVFVSEFNRRQFAAAFPTMAENAFAVPNAIDSGAWYADPTSRDQLIAYVGRAAPEKGFGDHCAALGSILAAYPEWRAVFVTNEWRTHAKWAEQALAPLSEFGDRVSVLKDRSHDIVRQTLQRAAIAVVPSRCDEGFGLAAIEGHAAGAAVISSGLGGLREASGDHALYLDSVTPRSIAAALESLISRADLRFSLASAGQRFVARTHDAAQRAAQLDDFRERLFARRTANGGA